MDDWCSLCGDEVPSQRLNRLAEMNVCDQCTLGDVVARLSERGWVGEVKRWTRPALDDRRREIHHLEVRFDLLRKGAVRASFIREGWRHALLKVFSHEIQAGDPLFDDAVYVRTDTPEPTRNALATRGVQSAIMDLVGEGGSVEVSESQVRFEVQGQTPPGENLVVELAVLTRCLSASSDS